MLIRGQTSFVGLARKVTVWHEARLSASRVPTAILSYPFLCSDAWE